MKPIVVEVTYNASRKAVWEALTDPEKMVQWYFEQIPDFQPVPGFSTSFSVHTGEREFLHHWEVTEVVRETHIAYAWLYPDYQGEARVRFELEDQEEGTRLRLLCWGVESYPQEIPEFSRESCLGGWKWFLEERLREFLQS